MFKPLQSGNWFYTEGAMDLPQTTTHETLALGLKKNKIVTNRKQMNYQNFRFDPVKKQKPFELPVTSSYRRDYAALFDGIGVTNTIAEHKPSHFCNRLPVNDFAMKHLTASEFKFMDDHLFKVSKQRQYINNIRQIRNQHVSFI